MLIQIKDKEYSPEELAVLAKAGVLGIAQKNDPASLTLSAPALHGPLQGNNAQYGLFTHPGVRPERWSAMSNPNSWLNILSVGPSDLANERLEIMTGQTADGSTNATGFCGDAPVPGKLKTCQQLYVFGDFHGKTDLNALPLIGQRKDRSDMSARILNQAAIENPFQPEVLRSITDTRSQLSHDLYRFGNAVARSTELVSIQGVAATDNSRFGWFHEFTGLDSQIKTGYVDVVSNVTCPAADSLVESYNALVTGTHSDGSGRTFTATWFDTMYALRDRAAQVGMNGVQWAVVMRQEMFRTVAEVLSNDYNFYQVTGAQYKERNSTGELIQALRRDMMAGGYLLDDQGQTVPVIFSEGLTNPPVANNTYVSDILIVPVSWNGTPLIRLDYFPMNNSYIEEFAGFVNPDTINIINNGMYMVGQANTPLCVEFHFAARMRLILETPFLAGRIDDIRYTYFAKSRQAIPGSSLYVDGGVSAR